MSQLVCAPLRVFRVFGMLSFPALALYWLAGVVTGVMGLDPLGSMFFIVCE
jgi:hypothetical protein